MKLLWLLFKALRQDDRQQIWLLGAHGAADDGRVRTRAARRVDVITSEHHRIRKDLNQLLVQEAHVARAKEAYILGSILLDSQQFLLAHWHT
jgi:hypothetical protein